MLLQVHSDFRVGDAVELSHPLDHSERSNVKPVQTECQGVVDGARFVHPVEGLELQKRYILRAWSLWRLPDTYEKVVH